MARYFTLSNTSATAVDPKEELLASLNRINTFNPPVHTCSTGWRFSGLYSGPTSIAYLFYRLSLAFPDLTFKSQSLQDWAEAYIELGSIYLDPNSLRKPLVDSSHCGIANEHLCQLAVRAVLFEDASLAEQLCSHSSTINHPNTENNGSNEWLYGRAGYLYILRLLRSTFPDTTHPTLCDLLIRTISTTINRILATPQPWTWHNKTYLGAAHGSIGIITQVLLSSPGPTTHAAVLEPLLRNLLAQQTLSGNFPSSEGSSSPDRLVQFCHGAPGFVVCLRRIKPFFSTHLQENITHAITRAEECILARGLLTKPPSLCHGIAGNALSLLPTYPEVVEAWLSGGMSSEVLEGKAEWMQGAGRTDEFVGLWTGEAGRAWAWGVMLGRREGRVGNWGFVGWDDV